MPGRVDVSVFAEPGCRFARGGRPVPLVWNMAIAPRRTVGQKRSGPFVRNNGMRAPSGSWMCVFEVLFNFELFFLLVCCVPVCCTVYTLELHVEEKRSPHTWVIENTQIIAGKLTAEGLFGGYSVKHN